jgi:multimeric flavodoxin WrbA
MKVVTILGSSRQKGNSKKALDASIDGVKENTSNIEIISLGKLKTVLHCLGCDACKRNRNNTCILNDDLNDVIIKIRNADSIIISTPIYFFGFNSLTKAFIDRAFYSSEGYEGNPSLLKDKRFGLILTYGDADVYKSGAINAINCFKDISNFVDFSIESIIYGTTPEKIGPSQQMIEECKNMGRKISK